MVQAFTHSIMYGLLSSCPVEKLTYTIVDPENRGNSISPFFDAKKKLPELFGEKIYISKDEVAAKISKLNEKIENILQDKLGNQYDTIFDYANNTPDYDLNVEFIMLYDFPRGFDERTLAELRNVLRNGSKCGIYTVISYLPDPDNTRSREYHQSLQSIIDLSTVIKELLKEALLASNEYVDCLPSGEVILKKPIDPNDFEITIPDAVGLPGVYDDDCCDFQIDGFDEKVVILCDENSNEIKFDFLDLVPYRGKEYVVLLPVSDKADEVVILQLEEADDETESYISVDNELTLQAVFEIFKERAKDTFNFVD